MEKLCRSCQKVIPNRIIVDNKERNLQRRKFCLDCSPFGNHNTKKDINSKGKPKHYWEMSDEQKRYSVNAVKNRGIKLKSKLVELAGGKCILCGYKNPACLRTMSFHHRNPKEKLFELNVAEIRIKKWELVLEEFKKCDMLCLNCHAVVEHEKHKK